VCQPEADTAGTKPLVPVTKSYGEHSLEHLTTPSAQTLNEISALRRLAWEANGARPRFAPEGEGLWIDCHDEHADHWVVKEGSQIIAASRLCVHATFDELPCREYLSTCEANILWPAASFNRLVVHPQYRGNGLPSLFDSVRLIFARGLAARCVVGCAESESRIRNLLAVGFEVVCESPLRLVPYAATFVLTKNL
jgi:hypothetical protein